MIILKRIVKHGGPDAENGGIWQPGQYTIGDRSERDYSKPGKVISAALAQYFCMHGMAEATEGEVEMPGMRKQPSATIVQPANVTQPQRVTQPARRR